MIKIYIKKFQKYIVIFFILLTFTTFFTFTIDNNKKLEAVVQKVITKAISKTAKKSLTMVIEKNAKQTIKESAKKEVTKDVAKNYVSKEGFTMFHPANSGRVYQVIKPERMTTSQNKALNKAIEKNIDKKITGGRKWRLWENILDWIIDYKLWIGAPVFCK